MHWDGCGTVLQCGKGTYVDIPFIRRSKEEIYACSVGATVIGNLRLADDAPDTHSHNHVAFTRP